MGNITLIIIIIWVSIMSSMLVRVWSKKFDLEVRDIATADINGDGTDEIIVASWDARLHVLMGNGASLWSSERQEYPCESVCVLRDGLMRARFLVASCHRKLICYDVKGSKVWSGYLNSWIARLIPLSGISGIDYVVASDIRGGVSCISPSGETVWSLEAVSQPWAYSITYSDELRKIFSVRGKRLYAITPEDGSVESVGLNTEVFAVSHGSIDGEEVVCVGCSNTIKIVDGDSLKPIRTVRLGKQRMFRVIAMFDIDGDGNDELIAGSWQADRVSIVRLDQEGSSTMASYKLSSNPLSVMCRDINGDGYYETLIVCDDGLFVTTKQDILRLETIGSHHGAVLGNFLGYGSMDIVVRTTKEDISCYVLIPRMCAVMDKMNEGTIYAILPAGSKIEVDKIIVVDSKRREYSRRIHDGVSTIYYRIPFRAKFLGRTAKIIIRKKKGLVFEGLIRIPSLPQIDRFTSVVWLSDEDCLILRDAKIRRKNIRVESSKLMVHALEPSKEGLRVSVSHNLKRPASIRLTLADNHGRRIHEYALTAIPRPSISVDISSNHTMTTKDSLVLTIQNLSMQTIPAVSYTHLTLPTTERV
mgnify:CR=1 FL=1